MAFNMTTRNKDGIDDLTRCSGGKDKGFLKAEQLYDMASEITGWLDKFYKNATTKSHNYVFNMRQTG